MSALDAIYHRRATRAFTAAPVGDDAIGELLRAAIHAPTAMHAEPWLFAIVQDRALLARISDRTKAMLATPSGDDHHGLARHPESRLPAIFTAPGFDIFYGAGTLVAIGTRAPGGFAVADCWLAAQNLMLAATALGLATCPIGVAALALNDPAIKEAVGIPEDVTVVAPIIVGVAAGAPTPASRRAPVIVSWRRPRAP